ncbi:MAG: phospho-sugar mutase [Proteobacteria bacterium]|nr:phospho-sugar mutase [Pseudomonadota bacterium]
MAAHGLHLFFFESHRSTPELSFAVRHLRCDVGVMISASHNPPSDNGFKAYWSHGGQILPPHDSGIIECVYEAGEIPTLDFDDAVAAGRIEIVGEEVDREYVDAVASLSLSSERSISAVFTPLHGVGETSVARVLTIAGFTNVGIYEPHREPNGDFPNVPDQLPNPERMEIFAPVIERACETGASIVLASDPDADRLGVAAKNRDGEFVCLTGNQIGALIADYILRKNEDRGSLRPEQFVVQTLVTTSLIPAIARSHGVRVIDDLLVGFKYIGQTIEERGADDFLFGAEESLGYLAGSYARDKDAAIAALYILELAAELSRDGKTPQDRLDELWVQYGYFAETQRSEVCRGPQGKEQIEALMRAFRESPPGSLAGIPLARVRDYRDHEIRSLPDNTRIEALPDPSGDLLFFESVEADCRYRVAVRPSGTEPKIKFYFFIQSECESPAALSAVKERAGALMTSLQKELNKCVTAVFQET